MIYTDKTRAAMKLAFAAHEGQTDKAGAPYINHPLHVAELMTDEDTCVVALLHDVLEDTELTVADLGRAGLTEAQVEALQLLTHDPSVPYLDYIRALKGNPIARTVKLADLRHNLDLTRIPALTSALRERILNKYTPAVAILRAD